MKWQTTSLFTTKAEITLPGIKITEFYKTYISFNYLFVLFLKEKKVEIRNRW